VAVAGIPPNISISILAKIKSSKERIFIVIKIYKKKYYISIYLKEKNPHIRPRHPAAGSSRGCLT